MLTGSRYKLLIGFQDGLGKTCVDLEGYDGIQDCIGEALKWIDDPSTIEIRIYRLDRVTDRPLFSWPGELYYTYYPERA